MSDTTSAKHLLLPLEGVTWSPAVRPDGTRFVQVSDPVRPQAESLRVNWEDAPAGDADVTFVAHSLVDAALLVRSLESGTAIPEDVRAAIRGRVEAAKPGPWEPVLESSGGIAGISMIQLPGDDDPDLYLWLGDAIAPDPYLRFVAWARNGIPELLAI